VWSCSLVDLLEASVCVCVCVCDTFSHAFTQTGCLCLSSTPDFVPVTLGKRCQWLFLLYFYLQHENMCKSLIIIYTSASKPLIILNTMC
uniref:Uncharacterized protein n=1 Tax=Poecilia mexicana TaxID=48701 RepID=A0A3B3WYI3_9TELE